jgi:hypothetical protein
MIQDIELIKEIACDFAFECQHMIKFSSYTDTRDRFTEWFNNNQYHQRKLNEVQNSERTASQQNLNQGNDAGHQRKTN